MLKRIIKSLISSVLFRASPRQKDLTGSGQNTEKGLKEIFTEIYRNKKWGGEKGRFHSGQGSSEEAVVRPYVSTITGYLKACGHKKPVLVDLGCGDFEVGRHFIDYSGGYICVDIVCDLIRKLKTAGFGKHVKFQCLDITKDDLPDGDICFLRQVLQHLSNGEILKILPKIKKYKVAFITEHYPKDNPDTVPNRDIRCGHSIRLYRDSGVYLDKPPFNIPAGALQLMLEVPGVGIVKGYEQGVIRTYKLEF